MSEEKIKVYVEIENLRLRLVAPEGMLGDCVDKLETVMNHPGKLYLDIRDVSALFKDCSTIRFAKMEIENARWNDSCVKAVEGLLKGGKILILVEHGDDFSLKCYEEIMEGLAEASEKCNGNESVFLVTDCFSQGKKCTLYFWTGE
ncbi:MAG: hypothetical protein HUK20_05715 [Fibrobacter sp.]|nr:hypothetical protein [Fibrobacter sp.]